MTADPHTWPGMQVLETFSPNTGNEFNGLQVVEGAGAAPEIALGEVVQVDPGVGRVLLALDDRRRGVVGARVLCVHTE